MNWITWFFYRKIASLFVRGYQNGTKGVGNQKQKRVFQKHNDTCNFWQYCAAKSWEQYAAGKLFDTKWTRKSFPNFSYMTFWANTISPNRTSCDRNRKQNKTIRRKKKIPFILSQLPSIPIKTSNFVLTSMITAFNTGRIGDLMSFYV